MKREKQGRLRSLLALNGVLLALLAGVTFGPDADAQRRGPGRFTMVSGGVNGPSSRTAVYIVDVSNQELVALAYDYNEKTHRGVGYRNLAADTMSLRRPGG